MIHADTNALRKHNPKSFRPTSKFLQMNNYRRWIMLQSSDACGNDDKFSRD